MKTPDGLAVQWQPTGADIQLLPLRRPVDPNRIANGMLQTGLLFWAAMVVPLSLLQMFRSLPKEVPAVAMVGCVLFAIAYQVAMAIRRHWSELTIRIQPEMVALEHRIFGGHIITTEVRFDELRRIEFDDHGSLIFRYRDGRSTVEPLPAVPMEAREWILGLLLEAREATSGGSNSARSRAAEPSRR